MDGFKHIINSPIPTIVLFSAEWCVPCTTFKPIFDKAVVDNPFACFVKIDVDDDYGIDVSAYYDIQKLPCLKIFKTGSVVGTFAGKEECNAQTLNDVVAKYGNNTLSVDVESDDEF